MIRDPVASVGGKDLTDYAGLSRAPELNYLHKQSLPRKPRASHSAPKSLYQKLSTFAAGDYLKWIVQYCEHRIGFKHPFRKYDDPAVDDGVYALEGDDGIVRVALAGDWGTGTDEAFRVAERMKARDPHFTIHLGDVYFVGDPAEVRENFLGIPRPRRQFKPCRWPKGSKGAFALNGNHEMYARGYGYFDLILPQMGYGAPDRARPQKASYFCLQNEHWRVIALDTGYNSIGWPVLENMIQPDCALEPATLDWLRETLAQKDDRRAIVLLSHHQYFSRFDHCYTKPAEQLAEFIDRPVLWFWGHEHRLAIYEKRRIGLGVEAYGRCIGHGGMPVDLPGPVLHADCPVEFVDPRRYPNHEGLTVGINGFAALTFEGETLKAEYEDVYGETIFTEIWRTDAQGGLAREEVRKAADAPARTTAAS